MVSILTLTYNHENYISQALNSILMQKVNFNFEVIISDDFSTDNTKKIIIDFASKYPNLIKPVFRSSNIGVTKNFYETCKLCKGKYISILEGDDYWISKNKLQTQVDFLETNNHFIGVGNDVLKVDENSKPIKKHKLYYALKKINSYNKKFTMKDFLKGKANWLFQSSSLTIKNIFYNSGDKYEIIYKAHPFFGDGTVLAILLDEADFFLLKKKMSAHRVATSQLINKSKVSSMLKVNNIFYMTSVYQYVKILQKYFNNKYNFSFMNKITIHSSFKSYKRMNSKEKAIFNKILLTFNIFELCNFVIYLLYFKIKNILRNIYGFSD